MRLLARAAAVLLLPAVGCGSPARLDSVHSAESSTDGRYVLRVRRVTRERDERGLRPERVVVHADVEGLGPDDLLEDGVVLEAAQTPDGVDHASEKTRYRNAVGTRSLNVSFPIDAGTERVSRLEMRVPVAHVEEWRPYAFEVATGESERSSCGPFWLRFDGQATRLSMSAGATPPDELRAYEERVPLRTITYGWLAQTPELVVADAKGRPLRNEGWAGSGRQMQGIFFARESRLDPAPELAYPLHVRLRVPEKFTLETARFRLVDVPVPPTREGSERR